MSAPPITYYGGKTRLARRIAALLPGHAHYVEPYGGSLAVLLAKVPSLAETVNDLDQRLMTFWRVLRDRAAELAAVCALTPHSAAEYAAAREPAVDELETARRVWVRLTQGRGAGGAGDNTGWRHHQTIRGSGVGMPAYLDGYRARLWPAAARLADVSLECRPALDVIAAYGRHADVCLYVDPPYLDSLRTGRYGHEVRTDEDHRALAVALHACRASVVLSGYPSPLYDELYSGWWRADLPSGTSQSGQWAQRTETLWSNRPLRVPVQMSLLDGIATGPEVPV